MPSPSLKQKTPPRPARPWYQDVLSAVAFFALALVGGKAVARMLGPIGGLFYLILTAGTGYFFARAAWNSLTEGRESSHQPKQNDRY